MSDDSSSIPRGRFKRLKRLAGLATQVGADLAAERVKRLFGQATEGPYGAGRRAPRPSGAAPSRACAPFWRAASPMG